MGSERSGVGPHVLLFNASPAQRGPRRAATMVFVSAVHHLVPVAFWRCALRASAVTHSCNEIYNNVVNFVTKKRVMFGGYAPARDRPPDRSHSFPGTPRDPPS